MAERRHPISPLAGPWAVDSGNYCQKPSGLYSLWPSEGLWSVGKQREEGLHPGTLSHALTASPGVAQTPRPTPQDIAGHNTQTN
ncbi:hypothetical protein KUCAC02_023631 [Chaenocephalus aceratus]|uniref:Uncharacterized protein n=1 Tax=Chaenocephalus aceratus TaxID=36190 RepID=A0ACB9WFJ7_CHAAC|nr:hypothetical protein KUCAC02_023631 [Chaenocephalus aceratus]